MATKRKPVPTAKDGLFVTLTLAREDQANILAKHYESIYQTVKVEPTPSGGWVVKYGYEKKKEPLRGGAGKRRKAKTP